MLAQASGGINGYTLCLPMPPEQNRRLIETFYAAFDRSDGDAMAACYAPDARFCDPAFGELRGPEVGGMWRMLTGRAEDLDVELAEHDADETTGTAHWIAHYTFRTGRPVVNDIQAEFRFENGLIAEHDDSFDFYKWSRQALGPPGLLLGWTPLLRAKVQKEARAGLDEFMVGGAQPGDAPGP
jgi:ketosteroid isomerase-like protein